MLGAEDSYGRRQIEMAGIGLSDTIHEEGDNFLSRVVTGDETWVSHATPESKQQSSWI